MDPTAPYPQQPDNSGQGPDPAAPPPGPPGSPSVPSSGPPAPPPPPVFQPGVATPSYGPPPEPGPPTTGYPPTSVYPATSSYQGYQASQQYPPGPPGPPGSPYQPGPAATPPPGKRSSGTLVWVLVAVFAFVLCAGAGVAGVIVWRNTADKPAASPDPQPPPADPTRSGDPAPTEEPSAGPTTRPPRGGAGATITYEISGRGTASIRYARGPGSSGTEEVTDARLPWQVQVKASEDLFAASVTALQLGNRDKNDKLTCRILVDGQEVTKRSGEFLVLCLHAL